MTKVPRTRVEMQPAPTQAAQASDVADSDRLTLLRRVEGSAFPSGSIDARRLTPRAILTMQRTAGNAAVNRLLATVAPSGTRQGEDRHGSPLMAQRRDDSNQDHYEDWLNDNKLFSAAFRKKYISGEPDTTTQPGTLNVIYLSDDEAYRELLHAVFLENPAGREESSRHKGFSFRTKQPYDVHLETVQGRDKFVQAGYTLLPFEVEWAGNLADGYFQIVGLGKVNSVVKRHRREHPPG